MTALHLRRSIGLLVGMLAVLVVSIASVLIGSKAVPIEGIGHALFSFTGTVDDVIIIDLRIPRTLVGLAVGAALGVSGALMQGLTRNPLADPGLLGVSAGSAFFVAIGVAVFGVTAVSGYVWFAFAGAIAATIAVYLIGSAGRGAADPIRLTLAGVALTAVIGGLTSAIIFFDDRTFQALRGWEAGSFVERDITVLAPVVPFLAVGLLLAFVVARPLNSIGLGDDLAASLGTQLVRTRIVVVIAVTLLAGGATAIAGPVGFIGLMVPHIARWIVGPDQRWIIPYSALIAPVVLLVADVIGRVILYPSEVPVGVVAAFVGAPVLIALVRRAKVSTS